MRIADLLHMSYWKKSKLVDGGLMLQYVVFIYHTCTLISSVQRTRHFADMQRSFEMIWPELEHNSVSNSIFPLSLGLINYIDTKAKCLHQKIDIKRQLDRL
jgi:hypothetical protein